jgi:GAF domain-containing protein
LNKKRTALSGAVVILGDARRPNPFAGDEYLIRRQPRSVFCLPLVRQTALAGVLYLENTLTSDVFTPDRTALLRLLASQLAISLVQTRRIMSDHLGSGTSCDQTFK